MSCTPFSIMRMVAVAAAICGAPAAAGNPPRYIVTPIDVFEPETTLQLWDVNDAGQATGQVLGGSGDAVLVEADGSVQSITTLPCLYACGTAINNLGTVAGTRVVEESDAVVVRAFRYTPEAGMVDLATPPNSNAAVIDINDAGTVIGTYNVVGVGQTRSFRYDGVAGFQDLGVLQPGGSVYAQDINNAGQIVGFARAPGFVNHAFIWEAGVLTDLGDAGYEGSTAYAINDAGQIAGNVHVSYAVSQAARMGPQSGIFVIPLPPGGLQSLAQWMTEDGTIFGRYTTAAGHAGFSHSEATGFVDLGFQSTVGGFPFGLVAVNGQGTALVHLFDETVYLRAYVWQADFGLQPIADLLTEPLDWLTFEARGINDAGQIIISSDGSGDAFDAALLTPVATGDLNCDGRLDGFDIDPFILALTDAAAYEATFPRCADHLADVNADGIVSGFDIDPFVSLLAGE